MVNIWPFFAIHFDADEVFIEELPNFLTLKRLSLHHVAPVASGVTHREKYEFVLLPCLLKCLLTPGVPRKLEIRVGDVAEGIGLCSLSSLSTLQFIHGSYEHLSNGELGPVMRTRGHQVDESSIISEISQAQDMRPSTNSN